MEPINVFDYEAVARAQMEPSFWDYYAGGSDDEATIQECRNAFARLRLRPRMLVDVSHCDTTTSVLGASVRAPILVAPTAFHCMAHPEGECATAQGASAAGSIMIVATDSTRSLEEVAQASGGPLWFQLYLYPTREIAAGLIRRAEEAGYKAIVLTVDMPALGNRERDRRNGLVIPPATLSRANFADIDVHGYAWNTVTWSDVEWLRSITKLPVLVKGILTAEDAVQALAYGVAGIVVSNHGGRQLDGSIPAIEALPEIVDAVAGQCAVFVDGGIRRGTDVLKALALGAQAVLVGRPILWGLAAEGAEGVQRILEILSRELELAMKLSGCPTLNDINRSLVKVRRYPL